MTPEERALLIFNELLRDHSAEEIDLIIKGLRILQDCTHNGWSSENRENWERIGGTLVVTPGEDQ